MIYAIPTLTPYNHSAPSLMSTQLVSECILSFGAGSKPIMCIIKIVWRIRCNTAIDYRHSHDKRWIVIHIFNVSSLEGLFLGYNVDGVSMHQTLRSWLTSINTINHIPCKRIFFKFSENILLWNLLYMLHSTRFSKNKRNLQLAAKN